MKQIHARCFVLFQFPRRTSADSVRIRTGRRGEHLHILPGTIALATSDRAGTPAAWDQRSNDKQRGVDWQITVGDTRVKLKSVYPKNIA